MKWVAILAACVLALALLGMGVWAYETWQAFSAHQQLAKAEQQRGDAIVGQGQALTRADVAAILANAKVREVHTQTIMETHDAAIAAAPGADAPLAPGFVGAVNGSLCEPRADRDDAACAALRAGPPGQLPPTGALDRATPY